MHLAKTPETVNQSSRQSSHNSDTVGHPSDQPSQKHTGNGKSLLKNLRISTTLSETFLEAVKDNTDKDIETLAFLAGFDGNNFVVTDIVVPKQTGTQNTCTTTDEQVMLDFLNDENLICLGWIHTHPSQSLFLSSVDLHMQCSLQHLLPEAVALVCSVKDNSNSVYSLSAQGMYVIS